MDMWVVALVTAACAATACEAISYANFPTEALNRELRDNDDGGQGGTPYPYGEPLNSAHDSGITTTDSSGGSDDGYGLSDIPERQLRCVAFPGNGIGSDISCDTVCRQVCKGLVNW